MTQTYKELAADVIKETEHLGHLIQDREILNRKIEAEYGRMSDAIAVLLQNREDEKIARLETKLYNVEAVLHMLKESTRDNTNTVEIIKYLGDAIK